MNLLAEVTGSGLGQTAGTVPVNSLQALSATIYSDSLQSVTVAVIVSDTTPIVYNGLAGRVTGVQKTEATFLTQVSDGVPSVMYPRAMTLGGALRGKRGEDANRPPRSERAPVRFWQSLGHACTHARNSDAWALALDCISSREQRHVMSCGALCFLAS
jgi:hypothetical protein